MARKTNRLGAGCCNKKRSADLRLGKGWPACANFTRTENADGPEGPSLSVAPLRRLRYMACASMSRETRHTATGAAVGAETFELTRLYAACRGTAAGRARRTALRSEKIN